MDTVELALVIITIAVVVMLVLSVLYSRSLERRVRAVSKEAEYFKEMWKKDYERYLMYKVRLIELTQELEVEREKEPIIKYVEDASRVQR